MNVAIYSRGVDLDQQQSLNDLIAELQKHDITIYIYADLIKKFNLVTGANKDALIAFGASSDLHNNIDCLISLGGDGTVLDAITLVGDTLIPILGINYGRLGFLATISKDELSIMVEALVNRSYVIDKRSLLHLDSNLPIFEGTPFALNEFAIHKRDTSPMIKIHTYLNGEFLNTYWADGLIVATPTGSTGYSLSCQGPIVFPESRSFVITPIAPHNLNVRHIVVPDTNVISFEIESRSEQVICSLDARREVVSKSIQLAVRRESFDIGLVRLSEENFLHTLRNKLTWGLDKRN